MLPIQRRLITNTKNFWIGRSGSLKGIVLHSEGASGPRAAGTVASLYGWFQNNVRRVSAHYYIAFDGHVEQYVLDENTAYQAGNLLYNAQTIGIEHQDDGAPNKYTGVQYDTSARLVAYLCAKYGIPLKTSAPHDPTGITIHKKVPGASTTCPVGLDWERILRTAQSLVAAGEVVTVEINEIPVSATIRPNYKPGVYSVIANALNIRATPDTRHDPLGVLTSNERVQINAVSGHWGQIGAFIDVPELPPADSQHVELPDPSQTACWISLDYTEPVQM